MFSTSFSSSKRENRQQNTQPVSSSPSLSNPSGRKRARSSLSSLAPSLSCPHLPLLATGKSSPPIVTATSVTGTTTPTVEIFWGVGAASKTSHPQQEEVTAAATTSTSTSSSSSSSSSTNTTRRLSMSGFPWESRAGSGRMSPAAELTGNIARRAVTPPAQLAHDSVSGLFRDKASPKSNLRLELPPPRLDGSLGSRIEQPHTHSHSGFVGQPLLGLAYPTTPYIGLNDSPVMCEGCKDGGHMHSSRDDGRGGIVPGGAAAAAQHVLLAAAPHMGRGGLALLTPPDDNGILDWQQDGIHRIQADRETTERMINAAKPPTLRNSAPPIVEKNPRAGGGHSGGLVGDGLIQGSSNSPDAKSNERSSEDELDASTEGEWIGSAIDTLVGSAFPACSATEAIRVLSYTLPCPLPDAPGPEVPASSANPTRPDRLPISAASAPDVAAAAGQQLSPAVLARCTAKEDNSPLPFKGADLGTTTALHHMTEAIQRRCMTEETRRVYIQVFYAIDPQIPLTRLPSTPPVSSSVSSPGRLQNHHDGGEGGYFSPTVFTSIVVAPNSLAAAPTGGPNPHAHPQLFSSPIVPPNSLHLTLLERYIPPASFQEDTAMFSAKSSILIDRLFELSPQGGSLLFIYPTKTGAKSFDREYLGPVLDPLLRKLMVLYRLREDLLWSIRNMSATEKMAEYPVLQERMQAFCKALTNGEGDLPRMPTKIVYSTKATVSLNELSWREWWTQQEQSRIREIVKRHMASQPGPESSSKGKETESKNGFWTGYGVPGDLAREVLDGVRAPNVRPSSRGMGEAVLASSMSGSGGGGGTVGGTAGMGRIAGGTSRLETLKKRGVEVGIFILRRGSEY